MGDRTRELQTGLLMDGTAQRIYRGLGNDYWWTAGKTDVIRFLLAHSFPPTGKDRVADVGCGPGHMIEHFGGWGAVTGLDFSRDAVRAARDRGYRLTLRSDARRLPLRTAAYDLVFALDIVEHIVQDRRVCREIARICKPGGRCVIVVPALRFLWGAHDDLYGHVRRYTLSEVRRLVTDAGLRIEKLTYVQILFLLPLLFFRRIKKLLPSPDRGDFVTLPPAVNAGLRRLVAAERWFLRYLDWPIGVSIVCVARK